MNEQAGGQPWTVLRLINWTKEYLAGHEVESPRLAAEVLLAHVLHCPRIALYTQFEKVPLADELAAYRGLVKRSAAHEPVAYLVGHREFYGLDFVVAPGVLIPRPETELLVDKAVEHLKSLGRAGAYWDACTGSGAVAVAVAKHVADAGVLGTDTSAAALAVARQNAEAHGLAGRVTVAEANLLDLPAALAGRAPFDAITANPPYVSADEMAKLPPEVRHEPAEALLGGKDGLDCIAAILQQAPNVLAEAGMLAVEIGCGQAEAVWDRVNAVGRYERVEFARDQAGIERVVVAYKEA
jgi:release factor glutamine methyltransferase